ncbi:hypothetical protein AAHE18_07G112700 [Arachis hypogaea]
MGGDFRQVLPVVPKGSKSQMISASIVKSHLWAFTKILHLRQNMRSLNDRDFAEYLMRIGDGIEPTICEDLVQIKVGMAIPWEGEASIHKLIEETFPNLQSHGWDASYMVERAILTPKNHDVQQLNDIVINQFPGDERILASFDEVEGDTNNLYQQEYFNSISTGGLPPHMLKVKKGAPLMLLRNIDPKAGLCNGTRLLCQGTFQNMLDVEILTGHHSGKRAFLPQIKHKTTENSGLPFVLIRKQFPVRLSFALTINKSQGQTIPKVGIYLPKHVFSHGQLYVALSRSISQSTTKILVKEGTVDGKGGQFTKNVVFKEILLPAPQPIRNLFPRKLDPLDTFNEIAAVTLALTRFQHVSRVGEMRGHSVLLSALVERWRPETHTFHLPVGEVTVTLEDVSYILGLPINGKAITGRLDSSHQFLVENCIACFGREPGPDDQVFGKVNIAWVWRCRDTEPCDTQESLERYVRAHIFCVLGTIVFPDKSTV